MRWAVLSSSQRVSACEGSWGSAVPSVTHLLWTLVAEVLAHTVGVYCVNNTCLSSSMALYIQQVNWGSAGRVACDWENQLYRTSGFFKGSSDCAALPSPHPTFPVHREVLCPWNGPGLPDTNAPPACKSFSHSRVVYGSLAAYLIEWAENPKWG